MIAKIQGFKRVRTGAAAFTVVELLVVILTLAVLGAWLLPALANSRPGSQAFQCRNNHRQLILAWTMYADDNNDTLALNTDQSAPVGSGANLQPPWVGGKMDWLVHGTADPNTNILWITDPRGSSLAAYDGGKVALFRCPADNYLSGSQRAAHYPNRLRSIAMNGAVGGGNPDPAQAGFKPPKALVPPLRWDFFYAIKKSQFTVPGPAQSWVIMDQNPDSIDDAIYYADPYATNGIGQFMELPSSGHDGGCGVSFADGSADIHKWQDSRTAHVVSYLVYQRVDIAGPPSADLAWLARHTPVAR